MQVVLSKAALSEHVKIRASSLGRRLYKHKYNLLLVIPFFLYIVVFSYIPMFGIIGAFQDFKPHLGYWNSEFVGFEHFTRFLSGFHFPVLLRNTVVLSFLKLVLYFPAPIILAILFNELRFHRFKRVTQTISYLPFFISWVVLLGITNRMLSPDGGVVNRVMMDLFGWNEPIVFMQRPEFMWPIAIVTTFWRHIGMDTIIYLAALTAVNPELYEAATIDGANRFQRIRFVSLPGMKPIIAIILIFSVGGLVGSNFEQMFILGTPATTRSMTEVFDTYILRHGLMQGNFSIGIAAGLMISVVSFTLLAIANSVVKKLGEESLW